jgi:hypothetical protein
MEIGIGLPNAVHDVDGPETFPEPAKQADEAWQRAGRGGDELILFPSSKDPDQVDLLADAVGK